LVNFVQDWPTKELAKSRLKNRRAYCKKMGYDQTDFGMAATATKGDNEGDGEEGEDEGRPVDEEDDGDEAADIDNEDDNVDDY
jgi:hypothetical protein